MNRLEHLRQTLPKNISDNPCPDLRFVVLDYNSPDNLQGWMRSAMKPHIQSGRLTYYRSSQPRYFSHSHSKNCAALLAETEFICNVDADNLTGPGFVTYLNNKFCAEHRPLVMCAKHRSGTSGRIALAKSAFVDIGGYDEEFSGWGREDTDLTERLSMAGYHLDLIEVQYLRRITHSDEIRKEMLPTELHSMDKLESLKANMRIASNRVGYRANHGLHWGRLEVRRMEPNLEWSESLRVSATGPSYSDRQHRRSV